MFLPSTMQISHNFISTYVCVYICIYINFLKNIMFSQGCFLLIFPTLSKMYFFLWTFIQPLSAKNALLKPAVFCLSSIVIFAPISLINLCLKVKKKELGFTPLSILSYLCDLSLLSFSLKNW